MCPPCGVNLMALFRRLTSTCVRRTASPSSVTVSSGSETVNVCRAAVILGRAEFHGRVDEAGEFEALLAQFDLPLRDARHVEQIVDDPHHVGHLAVEHLPRARRLGRVAVGAPQHLERESHRGQRISQFMRQDAEELVLPLVDQAQRFRIDAQRLRLRGRRSRRPPPGGRSDGRSPRSIALVFSTSVRGRPWSTAPSRGSTSGCLAVTRVLQRR